MIRAAFITPSLYWGGAERWMHDLAKYTKERIQWTGCAVTQPIYVDDTMKALFGEMMPVWGYGRKAIEKVSTDADVLIAWGLTDLAELAKGIEKPIVFVAHGSGEYDRNAVRGSLGRATHWAAVADMSTRVYEGMVPRTQVTVLHNGIDANRCAMTETRNTIRKRLGLTRNDFAVGYLGRLVPEKRPWLIAQAVARLPSRYKAVFVGDGWDKESQSKSIHAALGDRAIFHPRVEDIGNYLQAFDCFALVSPSEGFSLALLEAMYCRVPIICTPVGAVPELEAKHGRLWEEVSINCTAAELAKGLLALESTPSRSLRARVLNAAEAVRENYLGEHMAERWCRYLTEIVVG